MAQPVILYVGPAGCLLIARRRWSNFHEFERIRAGFLKPFIVAMPTLTLYGLGRRGAVQFAPQSSCAEIVQEWCRVWAVSADEGHGLAIMCAEFRIFGTWGRIGRAPLDLSHARSHRIHIWVSFNNSYRNKRMGPNVAFLSSGIPNNATLEVAKLGMTLFRDSLRVLFVWFWSSLCMFNSAVSLSLSNT